MDSAEPLLWKIASRNLVIRFARGSNPIGLIYKPQSWPLFILDETNCRSTSPRHSSQHTRVGIHPYLMQKELSNMVQEIVPGTIPTLFTGITSCQIIVAFQSSKEMSIWQRLAWPFYLSHYAIRTRYSKRIKVETHKGRYLILVHDDEQDVETDLVCDGR